MAPETIEEGISYGVIKEKVDQMRREIRVIDKAVKSKASTFILLTIALSVIGFIASAIGYVILQNKDMVKGVAEMTGDMKVMRVEQTALSREIGMRFKIVEDKIRDVAGQGDRNKSHIMGIEEWLLKKGHEIESP